MSATGTLSVVATPIGNLEDLTFRGLRTLREVDLIAAEDTRRTSKLLAHYAIAKPLVSLHEHNEHREAPRIVERLVRGEHVALVSDAGTPGISDPGAELVRLAREAGVAIVPIPGPSAVTTALSVSGVRASEFAFLGFPPPSGAGRLRWLERLGQESGAVVFYEAPHRIRRTLGEVKLYCGVRPILVFRELSKIHESLVLWPSTQTLEALGEFVVVVHPAASASESKHGLSSYAKEIECLSRLTNELHIDQDLVVDAVRVAARLPPARLRNYLKKAKLAAKRKREDADG